MDPYSRDSLQRTKAGEGPGRIFYVIGGLIILCGTGIFVWFLYTGIIGIDDKFRRVVVPEIERMTLDPGSYTVFYEYRSNAEGAANMGFMPISGLRCEVFEADTDEKVTLWPSRMNKNYNLPSGAGYAVYEFKIESAGDYDFSCRFEKGPDYPVVVAVSKGFMKELMLTIFGCMAVLFVVLGGGIAMIIVTAVKRAKAAKGAW